MTMSIASKLLGIHSPQPASSYPAFLSTTLKGSGSLHQLIVLRQDGGDTPRQRLRQAASNPSPIARALLLLNDDMADPVVAYHAKYDTSEIVKIMAAAILAKTPLGQVIDTSGISDRDRIELMFIVAIDGYHHLNEICANSSKACMELVSAQNSYLEIGEQTSQLKESIILIEEITTVDAFLSNIRYT